MTIETSYSAAAFESLVDLDGGDQQTAIKGLINFLQGVNAGRYDAELGFQVGGTRAQATLTVSSTGSLNSETMAVNGITFTAVTSGATGNQFDISTTPATQAENMTVAFNNSSDLKGVIKAERSGAVVTLYSMVPGVIGDTIAISESLTNVALSDFATESTGVDGSGYEVDKL